MAKTIERTITTYEYNLGVITKSDAGFDVTPTRTLTLPNRVGERTLKKMLNDNEQVLSVEPVETLYRCSLDEFMSVAKPVTD